MDSRITTTVSGAEASTQTRTIARQAALAELRLQLATSWDVDDGMHPHEVGRTPLGRFVLDVAAVDETVVPQPSQRLGFLSFFCARRALLVWELSCDTLEPHRLLGTAYAHLSGSIDRLRWSDLPAPVPSYRGAPLPDLREYEATASAEAALATVRYLEHGDPLQCAYALSAADSALAEYSLASSDDYREWLVSVAAPAAFDCRELTPVEREAHRSFQVADVTAARDRSHTSSPISETLLIPARDGYIRR